MKIYAIRDEAIEAYGNPFFVKAQGMAVRIFMDEAKNPESQINHHPKDFSLWLIGEYNEQNGHIEPQQPQRVAQAADFTEKE